MSKRRVIFRADGNSQIGLGHVTRCLALADMLKEDFNCVFAIQAPSQALREQIGQVCKSLVALPVSGEYVPEARELTGKHLEPGDVVVLDGYRFDTDYQRVFKQAGHKLVCIDDIHAYHFVADVVINQAGGISSENYSRERYTKNFSGPQFAILRKDFLDAARAARRDVDYKKIFLCMGGADPRNHTLALLEEAAAYAGPTEINVLVGHSYMHLSELLSRADALEKQIHVHFNLNAATIRKLMETCGIAICPPSSVSYEFCTVRGLLFLHLTADNQQGIYRYLIEKRAALPFEPGKPDLFTQLAKRSGEMIEQQRALIDGLSNERLKLIFEELCN